MKLRQFLKGFSGIGGVVALNELCPELDGEEFKEITANKLSIGPNDVLVLFVDGSLTQEGLCGLRKIRELIPCREVLVLDGGMKIGVIGEGE